jgi:ADP-ribose pyrophosphatase YjhB (NUDIX family)
VIASVRFCPHCGQPIAQQLKYGKMRPVCPACGYIHFDDPKVAVVVFVEQDGKVLLILRGTDPQRGKWDCPAGYVDRGENPAQAAVRETAEETGLSVEITRLIDVTFDNGIIVIWYAAQVVGGALQAQDDAADARWFGPADLPELAFRSTQVLITAWSCKRDKSRE